MLPLDRAHPEWRCRLQPLPQTPCLFREARSVLFVHLERRKNVIDKFRAVPSRPDSERNQMPDDPVPWKEQPLTISRAGTMDSPNRQEPAGVTRDRSTRLTVNLSKDLVDRLRDTVYWIPQLTLSRLVEEAIYSSLTRLESANRGRYPRRTAELKPGRPRSVHQAKQIAVSPQPQAPIRSLDGRISVHSSLEQHHEGHTTIDSALR